MSRQDFSFRFVVIMMIFLIVSCSGSDTVKEPLVSEYQLDNKVYSISTKMYWEEADASGEVDEIRLKELIPGSLLSDLIVISPVRGPASLEGTYVYSKTGDIGTYDLVFVHGIDSDGAYEWFTDGEEGSELVVELDGKVDGEQIYRLVITDFTLNYGYWDYLGGKWVSSGFKQFNISYQGPIEK